MAAQTHPYLVITDGTTTCTLQDGSGGTTNYPLVRDGWAPAIAGLRASPLNGVSPYEDVVETLSIEINGASATAALANLVTLVSLLEQAARWYRGEAVTVVFIKIAPHGSTVSSTAAPLTAAVLGGAVGGAGVKLSPRWDEVGRNYVIPDVQVSIVRRGMWLAGGASQVDTDTQNNGDLIDIDLGAAVGMPSPSILLSSDFGFNKSTGTRFHGGFFLAGEKVGGTIPITITAAEGATATGYTSVTPAGTTHPRDTNVLRFTPTGTGETFSGALAPAMPAATDLVSIFVNVRPSATVSFNIRARLDSGVDNQYTPLVTVPANATQYPKWLYLGTVSKKDAIVALYLAITASAASSSLDIDTVVICDARATQVIALIGPADADLNGTVRQGNLKIDHGLVSAPAPAVTVIASGPVNVPVPYGGDAVLMSKAQHVYCLFLLTGGGTGANGDEYRQCSTSTDAVLSNVTELTRYPAYLVPQ